MLGTVVFIPLLFLSSSPLPRYHPPAAEHGGPHLGQHVWERGPEDGGDHHVHLGGGGAGLHHADGAEEEEEGAEAQETQRWVALTRLSLAADVQEASGRSIWCFGQCVS